MSGVKMFEAPPVFGRESDVARRGRLIGEITAAEGDIFPEAVLAKAETPTLQRLVDLIRASADPDVVPVPVFGRHPIR